MPMVNRAGVPAPPPGVAPPVGEPGHRPGDGGRGTGAPHGTGAVPAAPMGRARPATAPVDPAEEPVPLPTGRAAAPSRPQVAGPRTGEPRPPAD
ncbi:hypothetical protein QLR68_10605, partial [Micromonospora sp. DH15]|nr:hypothetical protein [Micromonospora sp. DH15]